LQKSRSDPRTTEAIERHYLIEKELANRLRNASREERKSLYTAVYDEFCSRVPDHSQALREMAAFPIKRAKRILRQVRFLSQFLSPDSVFLEVGAGDCGVSLEIAKLVRRVYALDVSNEITSNSVIPGNLELIISDGTTIPIPESSVDVAYSNQLMEHLHPDDAVDQLKNLFHSITKGGIYICSTPNRLSGPHDVSKYFDKQPTGFHLREYSSTELRDLFREIGFSKTLIFCGGRKRYFRMPWLIISTYESGLEALPHSIRRKLLRIFPFKSLLGTTVVGIK
jgi:SAM-dependent methyltransferase